MASDQPDESTQGLPVEALLHPGPRPVSRQAYPNRARLYLDYDGKFRTALQSHQGTLGLEFKW